MTEQVGQFGVFDRTSMELITRPRHSLSLSLHDSRYARMLEERRYCIMKLAFTILLKMLKVEAA